MSTTYTLSVHSEGILKNLRDQFTLKTTFLAELLQNSRRAGATCIEIADEGGGLVVEDDGKGIDDFNALFTLGQSGWHRDVMDRENPFGMGFAASLFAATQIVIHSRDRKAVIDTAAALAQAPIEVVAAGRRRGTRVELALRDDLRAVNWAEVLTAALLRSS